jgi:hypothetical protein
MKKFKKLKKKNEEITKFNYVLGRIGNGIPEPNSQWSNGGGGEGGNE